jgi:hypothetical protein
VIKPLALLREFEHVGARITNSAEHPSVLGWERVEASSNAGRWMSPSGEVQSEQRSPWRARSL